MQPPAKSSAPSTETTTPKTATVGFGVAPLARTTFSEWSDDKATKLAASLAYYTVFSLPSLFVIAIAMARLVVSPSEAREKLMGQMGGLLGTQGSEAVQNMVDATYKEQTHNGSIIATIIGVLVLFVGASAVFGELQDSMNDIWKVEPKKDAGWKSFLKQRLFSFSMVLSVGFLLTVSLILSAVVGSVANHGSDAGTGFVLEAVNFLVSFVVTSGLFALIFKYIPDTKIQWRDVGIGGILTAILFTIGKTVIGLYLSRSGMGTMFGAAGSILLVFAWVYYTAQIVFFGAEFTKVYASRGKELPRRTAATNPPGA